MPEFKDAVIVATRRSAVGRALKGALAHTRPDEFAIQTLQGTLGALPESIKDEVDDLVLGCAMPEAEQGLNVARVVGLRAGLPVAHSAMTINRFCSSGLQAVAMVAERIMLGVSECGIGGGLESMSMIPMGGHTATLHVDIVRENPEIYISMGLTAENVARRFEISREDQDAFAMQSHTRAIAAIQGGRFRDEIVPIQTQEGRTFSVDEGPRPDTTLPALGQLRPAFAIGGSVTAGNSSPLSDGAAMTVLMSQERASALGLTPLARFVGYATAGVDPAFMGIGPVEAIPKVLRQTGLRLADIDLIELNEAFAAQSLAVMRTLGLDPERVNVNGGAIALGHPLGCTGAKLTASAIHELRRRNARYAMVTMCVGGGMGAAGIFERL